jgi:hypothetical protein
MFGYQLSRKTTTSSESLDLPLSLEDSAFREHQLLDCWTTDHMMDSTKQKAEQEQGRQRLERAARRQNLRSIIREHSKDITNTMMPGRSP